MSVLSVRVLDAAAREVLALPSAEQQAMGTALRRLEVGGDTLGYPHTAAVKGAAETLRELRPRAGRSRWRAFYRREGDELVVAAVGPEAQVNQRRFDRAVRAAVERLAEDRRVRAEARAKDDSDGEELDG